MKLKLVAMAAIIAAAGPALALDINVTWHDAAFHTWTAAEKLVVERAVLEWEAAINMPGTVDIGMGWEESVPYGAVTYIWNWPTAPGTDWYPGPARSVTTSLSTTMWVGMSTLTRPPTKASAGTIF